MVIPPVGRSSLAASRELRCPPGSRRVPDWRTGYRVIPDWGRDSTGLKHFGNDHLALATNRACLQGLAGELLVAVAIILFDVAMRLGRRDVQQFATASKLLFSVAIGEEAVIANPLEAFGKNVQ